MRYVLCHVGGVLWSGGGCGGGCGGEMRVEVVVEVT